MSSMNLMRALAGPVEELQNDHARLEEPGQQKGFLDQGFAPFERGWGYGSRKARWSTTQNVAA